MGTLLILSQEFMTTNISDFKARETGNERTVYHFSYGLLKNAMSPVVGNGRHLLNTYFVVHTVLSTEIEEMKIACLQGAHRT